MKDRRSFSRKILMSLAALGSAGAIAGLGTYASFTSTTSATHQVSTGTIAINLGASGAANRLSVAAINVVPGDTIERAVDLISTSSAGDMGTAALTTTASPSSKLDTDATNGLQMVLDLCSVAWTEAGTNPAYTYTCSGTTTPILTTRAVIGSNMNLAGLGILTAAGTDHLRLKLSLPSAAGTDNTFQTLTSTINYSFVATSRAGTSR